MIDSYGLSCLEGIELLQCKGGNGAIELQPTKLCIVQYAGDIREAVSRLNAGSGDTYGAQRYTVEYVQSLAARVQEVTTIVGVTKEVYDEDLPGGGRAVGLGGEVADEGRIIATLARLRPNALLLRYPAPRIMQWASRAGVRTLLTLADSFSESTLKSLLKRTLFGLRTWPSEIEAVANHGVNASRQLLQCGVPAKKVLAWDYPQENRPDALSPKRAGDRSQDRFDALFVGAVTEGKGVGDLLSAVKHLHATGRPVSLGVIGADSGGHYADAARAAEIGAFVTFLGQVPHREIIFHMRKAGAVVVPSRHGYPEGLPLTIYEALCARSGLVVTDHPMFRGNIVDGISGLVVPERNSVALADAIWRLKQDDELYEALSNYAPKAWQHLQIETKWHHIIDAWLEGKSQFSEWLSTRSYAS